MATSLKFSVLAFVLAIAACAPAPEPEPEPVPAEPVFTGKG